MNRWLLACAAVLAVSAVVSLVNGHPAVAAISAGLTALGLASAYLSPGSRSRSVELSLALYTTLFNAALVAAAVFLIVAAVASRQRDRGGYLGLAILIGTAALALSPLTVALWRRSRSRAGSSRSEVEDDPGG